MARTEARTGAPCFDLDAHPHVAIAAHQIDLGGGRLEPPADHPQPAAGQVAGGEELADPTQLGRRRTEKAQEEARCDAGEEPPPDPQSFSAGSSVSTFWIALRLKRSRTPSATCRTITSSWICATLA